MKLSLIVAGLALISAAGIGCSTPVDDGADGAEIGTSEAALGEAGTLTFGADFQVRVSGTLEKGKKLRVAYDASRLTACRGEQNGKPAWTITGFYKIGGGAVRSFEAGGFSPSSGTNEPVLALDASGDLQIWFQNNNRWGCNAFDSAFGANYHFAVKPAASEPGWVGNVRSVTSRATCNDGGVCDADLQALDTVAVNYDTWTRQRAAIRGIYFEVWKDGVTNWDNPDLWRQLDVKVHSRVGSAGAFKTSYVTFERRIGNNARYAAPLAPLDPIPGQFTLTNAADCPSPIHAVPSGGEPFVETTVELYFTVNGVEVRPSNGGTYRVKYVNYKAPYAICPTL